TRRSSDLLTLHHRVRRGVIGCGDRHAAGGSRDLHELLVAGPYGTDDGTDVAVRHGAHVEVLAIVVRTHQHAAPEGIISIGFALARERGVDVGVVRVLAMPATLLRVSDAARRVVVRHAILPDARLVD